ncbi:hypothetical protein DFP92_1182 [Yoonia sediminilitoris]|uniref:Uncharacterized protein n=1 Tax=Yoonia sediminilitoris TaxID=1286148 RepID=A0A2T6K786_9RHOB|nr:hypothetical protein C8N45_11841 [Yoonia sediminilitoris]RCW90057.1 hypothetical protein DFP92_1182 [Yoonia sediminilitoris]
MRELSVRNLQFDAFTTNCGPVFAPIELERLTGLKHQRHKRPVPCRLFQPVPISAPRTGKSRHTLIRSIVPELDQVLMHQLHGPALFTRLPRQYDQHLSGVLRTYCVT